MPTRLVGAGAMVRPMPMSTGTASVTGIPLMRNTTFCPPVVPPTTMPAAPSVPLTSPTISPPRISGATVLARARSVSIILGLLGLIALWQ
ncbi:MAG: hypothetical protein Q9227_006187 [Pyrenula ochraceoflavens]